MQSDKNDPLKLTLEKYEYLKILSQTAGHEHIADQIDHSNMRLKGDSSQPGDDAAVGDGHAEMKHDHQFTPAERAQAIHSLMAKGAQAINALMAKIGVTSS